MIPNRSDGPRRRGDYASTAMLACAIGLVVAIVAAAISLRDDGPAPAAAASEDAVASVALLIPDDRLDPRIIALELTGLTWQAAVDRFDAALFAVNDNTRRLRSAQERLVALTEERDGVETDYTAISAEVAALDDRIADVEVILRARALDRFLNFGTDDLVGLDDPSLATDAARSTELSQRVDEVQFSTRDELLARQSSTEREQLDLLARQVELAAEIESTSQVIGDRETAVPALLAEVDAAAVAVRSARWTAGIPGLDLSVVALDAYLNAEDLLADVWPSCNARWWMIAGVARIESRHGRYGGRTLRADGRVDRPIIGIPLDGGPGVRAIHDTDDGEFDGDDVWDRAVGPLQFIPETWLLRGRDGSGDGWADPQNMYDAAYSAGRYLCAIGGDLSSRANLRRAYFGYNNSSAYVDDVIGHADRYADFTLPDPPAPSSAVVGTVENAD
ncbi:MAG: lytic transglycosylase domain-containing protein [Acidimicrobiales bacterium]|nr:lytic transglycosylase domain-containing protein [Acidimicrobiales bacterium]